MRYQKEFSGLIEFVSTVDEGGFTAAAQALGRSPAYVSRRVSALESRLGAKLLHRTTRQIALTELGAQYYDKAVGVLAELEAVEDALSDQQERAIGRIRVTAGGQFGAEEMARALAEFSRAYPDVKIHLDVSTRQKDLIGEGFDLAVRHALPHEPNLIARRLAIRRMLVCAAPSYLERHGVPAVPADLADHNCLTSPGLPWMFEIDGVPQEQKVGGTWSTNDGVAATQAAIAGLGIARLADTYVRQSLADGSLVAILSAYEMPPSVTYIVYPDRKMLPYRVRLLIDFLVQRFA